MEFLIGAYDAESRSTLSVNFNNKYMWQHWANALLGIAVIVAAFVGLTGSALVWTLGVLGALIAIIGFWGASSAPESESMTRHA